MENCNRNIANVPVKYHQVEVFDTLANSTKKFFTENLNCTMDNATADASKSTQNGKIINCIAKDTRWTMPENREVTNSVPILGKPLDGESQLDEMASVSQKQHFVNPVVSDIYRLPAVAGPVHTEEKSVDSEDSTSDSNFSELSDISDISGRDWKPPSTLPLSWVQKQMHCGADPRELLSQIIPSSTSQLSPGLNDMTLWRILASLISEPPRRQKLSHVNTFEDVVQLILRSSNIIVLTGAGVSVSCGIPDFRSSDGIYARLSKDFPDLPDPQAMFDISYFSRDPRPFYRFAREIYPGEFQPSPCHQFIKLLEDKGKLLRNYTQNIDTLEQVVGIRNVIECHGSFSTATCTKCKWKCTAEAIKADIFSRKIPVCPRCQPNTEQSAESSNAESLQQLRRVIANGIMKPDIVFFGEGLPQEFHTVITQDKEKCDLLIVMGSSLKVRPVALIPSSISPAVPQILINREKLQHLKFDVELLGNADVVINQLCHCLGDDWKHICFSDVLAESSALLSQNSKETENDLPCADVGVKSGFHGKVDTPIDSEIESSSSCEAVGLTNNSVQPNIESNSMLPQFNLFDKGPSSTTVNILDSSQNQLEHESRDIRLTTLSSKTVTANNSRHLSIDSSKDSGIQSESGHTCSTLGDAFVDKNKIHLRASGNCSIKQVNVGKSSGMDSDAANDWIQQQQRRELDRLINGTFYHGISSTYIFPGAQVSWSSDSEEDEDYNVGVHDVDAYEESATCAEVNVENRQQKTVEQDRLSPLLPPSLEAEMVSVIKKSNTFSEKKYSPTLEQANTSHSLLQSRPQSTCKVPAASCISNTTNHCIPPPIKRCRNSNETGNNGAVTTAFIARASISNGNDVDNQGIPIQPKCNSGTNSLETVLH